MTMLANAQGHHVFKKNAILCAIYITHYPPMEVYTPKIKADGGF